MGAMRERLLPNSRIWRQTKEKRRTNEFSFFRLCIVNEETNHIHVYIMATPIKLELIRLTRTIYLKWTRNVLSKLNNHKKIVIWGDQNHAKNVVVILVLVPCS